MRKSLTQEYPGLVTSLALIVAFTLVYFYEKSVLRLIRSYQVEFVFPPWILIILSSLAPFLILILIFALAWLGLQYLSPSRVAATLWVLFGLIIISLRLNMWFRFLLFTNDITFPGWLRPPAFFGRIRWLFMDFGAIGYESSIYYLACGSILIGIAALIRYRKEKRNVHQIEYDDQNAEMTDQG